MQSADHWTRFHHIFQNFGAKGDGVTDDTAAIKYLFCVSSLIWVADAVVQVLPFLLAPAAAKAAIQQREDTKCTSGIITDLFMSGLRLPLCTSHQGVCLFFPTSILRSLTFDVIRTYKVTKPLIAFYQTQLIGDARTPPTLLAANGFSGIAVIGVYFRRHCAWRSCLLSLGAGM